MNLSERITGLRKSRKLTQREIADKLGISRVRYSAWENAYAEPDTSMLTKLAEIHNVTVDYLLGLTDDSQPMNSSVIQTSDTTPYKDALSTPEWATSKDKRDFKKFLEQDAEIMFDGVPMNDESKQRILGYVEAMFWDAKKQNKRKKKTEE